jgi:hypothetical protein
MIGLSPSVFPLLRTNHATDPYMSTVSPLFYYTPRFLAFPKPPVAQLSRCYTGVSYLYLAG